MLEKPFFGEALSVPEIADYEPLRARPLFELGRGGMGTVALASLTGVAGFERLVVVKRMFAHLQSDPEAVRRFLNEARIAACIHHANVVGVQQIGLDPEGYYLLLDYVDGPSLHALVDGASARGETLPRRVLFRIVLDVLAGLEAVHDACDSAGRPLEVLHRDVSPQNILLGRDGVARLADFGIARDATCAVGTRQHEVVGKSIYMPPEYLLQQPVDRRFDIYSLAVTFWIGLAGERPWEGANQTQIWSRALREGLPPVCVAGVLIPPSLQALVDRASARSPADRFSSARAMAEALEALAAGSDGLASHAEVSAAIRAQLGPQLTDRQQQISSCARLVSAPLRSPSASSLSAIELPSSEPRQTTKKQSVEETLEPEPARRVPGQRSASLAVAVAVLGALALNLAIFLAQRSSVAAVEMAASAPAVAAPGAQALAPRSSSVPALDPGQAPAPPDPAALEGLPARAAQGPGTARSAVSLVARPAPLTSASAPTVAAPRSVGGERSTARGALEVSTVNPYR